MKKSFIYILIFLNLSFLFADSYITINNQTISLDTSIKEIQGLFGIQKELDIIPFEQNPNWDTFCYKYADFTVYSSRITKLPFKIEIFSENQSLTVNDKKIVIGTSKKSVESIIGKISFDGMDNNKPIYVYYLLDNKEVGFVFDENDNLKLAYLSYTPMD